MGAIVPYFQVTSIAKKWTKTSRLAHHVDLHSDGFNTETRHRRVRARHYGRVLCELCDLCVET